ncbi:MAG: MarR family winged helix-turn-helix transcriptional regulator [Candidatus Saccharimonadales bacterium]
MGPANSLFYLVQHLAAVMGRQSEEVLQERLGIGLSQFKILMVLEWNPRVSQRVIADSLGQTEASISRQVKTLTAKDLLSAKRDPGNRRKFIISPTPRGMQLTESANELLRRGPNAGVPGLDESQVHELATGLQQLHRAVCRPGRPGSCNHGLGL